MLSNAYFLAKVGFDTAENEPAKNLQNFAILPKTPRGVPGPLQAARGADRALRRQRGLLRRGARAPGDGCEPQGESAHCCCCIARSRKFARARSRLHRS